MVFRHNHSIAIRTIGAVLLLWLLLAGIAWQAAKTPPDQPAQPIPTATETPGSKLNVEQAAPQTTRKPAPVNLLHAIEQGNSKAVLDFVKDSNQLTLTDALGNTALHYAARQQRPLLARLLLAHGANPEQTNHAGALPIQLNRQDTAQFDRYSKSQRHLLNVFIAHQRREGQAMDNIKAQAVFEYAGAYGEFQLATQALRLGANPAATMGTAQQTLLHLNRSADRVDAYLGLGVPLNARDKTGRTALSLAIAKSNYLLAKTLLGAGADISVTENHTDLGIAVGSGFKNARSLAKLLLKHGAPLGQSEWLRAIHAKDAKVVQLFMQHSGGFDPASADGLQRIADAQKLGGDAVLKTLQRNPNISAFIDAQTTTAAAARDQQLQGMQRWLAPHVMWLLLILVFLAGISLAPVALVNKSLRWKMLIGGTSTAFLAHLFLFNQNVELALAEFRFFGEPAPAFRTALIILGDGLAFALGAGIAVVWTLLPKNNTAAINLSGNLRFISLVFYGICVGVLIGHNQGTLQWPSQLYRHVSGYDAYVERKEREAEQNKQARRVKLANKNSDQPAYVTLFDAVKTNSKATLASILASGVDINAADRKGNTAVHQSMYPPRPEMLEFLIEAGASLEQPNNNGQRPLHKLLKSNLSTKSMPVLKALINAGVQTNLPDAKAMTPLCLALNAKQPRAGYSAAKLLLQAGAQLHPEPDCAPVIQTQHPDLLKFIVQQGADIDALQPYKRLADQHGSYLASALWRAAYEGDSERIKLLIALGANIESRDTKFGMTPLQAALFSRHAAKPTGQQTIRLLVTAGARIDLLTWDGRSSQSLDAHKQLSGLLATNR